MILHVLSNDGPGGTQAVTLGHARALAARGVSQTVVFCGPPSERSALRDELTAVTAVVRYLPLRRSALRFAVRLLWLFLRSRPSAVLTHGLGFHVVVAVAARLAGVRRVVVLVGNPVAPDLADLATLRRRSRVATRFVHQVIACSEHVARTVVENVGIDERMVRTTANPLDVEGIRSRAASRRGSRVATEAAVVCTVARLDPIKDHETVLRAVAILRDDARDVRLWLVGGGPTEPRLRRLAEELRVADRVEFLGDRGDIPELLGESDVFAFGMTWDEGFGVAVAEAMAAGTPIVCTEAGPASEVLDGGTAGLLVPPGDAAAMAEGIRLLLDDPEVRERLTFAASELAARRHDEARMAEELSEVLGL